MPSSSPYAVFSAEAWMRESLIVRRGPLAREVSMAPAPVAQGELFLFPVVVCGQRSHGN